MRGMKAIPAKQGLGRIMSRTILTCQVAIGAIDSCTARGVIGAGENGK